MKKKYIFIILLCVLLLGMLGLYFLRKDESWEELFEQLDEDIRIDWVLEPIEENNYRLFHNNYVLEFTITDAIEGFTYEINDEFQYGLALLCSLVDKKNDKALNRFSSFYHGSLELYQDERNHISIAFEEDKGMHYKISLSDIIPLSATDHKIFYENSRDFWNSYLYQKQEEPFSSQNYYYHILIQDEGNQKVVYFGERNEITNEVIDYVKDFLAIYYNENIAADYHYYYLKNNFYERKEFRIENISLKSESLLEEYAYLKLTMFNG